MRHIDTSRHIQHECVQQVEELKAGRLFVLDHFITVTDVPSQVKDGRLSSQGVLLCDLIRLISFLFASCCIRKFIKHAKFSALH